jgi:hypothetical protein
VPERLTLTGKEAVAPTDPDLEDIDVYFERTGRAKDRQ